MKVYVATARQVQGGEILGTLIAVGNSKAAAKDALKAHITAVAVHFGETYYAYVDEHIRFQEVVEVEVSTEQDLKNASYTEEEIA